MKRNEKKTPFATIGHSDDYLDRREELFERQERRNKSRFQEQERELRRQLKAAGGW